MKKPQDPHRIASDNHHILGEIETGWDSCGLAAATDACSDALSEDIIFFYLEMPYVEDEDRNCYFGDGGSS